jgi:hypothetical protein
MRKYLLLTGFILIFGCNQDALSPAIDCLGEVETDEEAQCQTDDHEAKFCEIREVGKYVLTDESKSYMPLYCEAIGSTVVFTNGLGDDQVFTLQEKGYVEEVEMFVQNILCEDESEKRTLDCIEHERAFIVLSSELNTFELSITSIPDRVESDLGKVGDFFRIKREEVPGFFVEEWLSVTDQRSLSYAMEPCTQFYPDMALNGTSFQNVIGFEEQGDCANYRYYINQDYGLVAFSRADGVLWSLK